MFWRLDVHDGLAATPPLVLVELMPASAEG
jgi:hypothetical protein